MFTRLATPGAAGCFAEGTLMISRIDARTADTRGRARSWGSVLQRHRLRSHAAGAMVVLTLATAACGSDGDKAGTAASTTTAAVTSAASGAAASTSASAATASGSSAAVETTSAAAAPAAANDESGTVNLWLLEDKTANPLMQARIDEFNKTSKAKVKMSTYVNDAYKQKLQVSMGSPNAPDIFFNWGGGNLKQFVDAGQVLDMTEALAASGAGEKYLPSVLDIAKIGDKNYGVPMSGMQPMMLFYNTKLFADAGVQPPKTHAEWLTLVDTFKAKKVIPVALAGAAGWTELQYLMYFADRNGGQQPFNDISDGKPDAWKNPAITKALQQIQELVDRGAFGTNFAGVNYDNQGASKLLATGKAAMMVMGAWEFGGQKNDNPKFMEAKGLGWAPFPVVEGGTGDPKGVVGVPANFFSVNAATKSPKTAVDFLTKVFSEDKYVSDLVNIGQVPAVKGVDAKLKGTDNEEFTSFSYGMVADASTFTLAWDQALSPQLGTEVNKQLQRLFLKQITPEEFIAAVEKVK